MIDLTTKYGVNNSTYRLLKEIHMVKLDIRLLEIARSKTAISVKNNRELKLGTLEWENIEKIIVERDESIKKKKEKLNQLLKELKEMRKGKIDGNCRI